MFKNFICLIYVVVMFVLFGWDVLILYLIEFFVFGEVEDVINIDG